MDCRPLLVPLIFFVTAVAPGAYAQAPADGVPICTATGDQRYPAIASDGAGGAIVVWSDARSGAFDLYAQRMNAAGVVLWAVDGVAVSTLAGLDYQPMIVPDGTGGAIIAWQLDVPGGTIQVQRIDETGALQWPAVGPKVGVALCTIPFAGLPSLAADGSGGAIVTWRDFRLGTLDIYAQRVDDTGTPLWTANGVAVCTAVNDQLWPGVIADGAGGAIIVWFDKRTAFDIYMERLDDSGSPQWGTGNGVLLGASTDLASPAQIIADGAGGAIVAWERDQAHLDIVAQRVTSAGTILWAGGASVCADGNAQLYPQLVSDGAAGAIITWQDNRNSPGWNVYTQHVNAAGVPQWATNGIALSDGSAETPVIASNGAGGVFIAWDDSRTLFPHRNIYGHAVSAAGATGWPGDGTAVCTATGDQGWSRIESSASVAIVTWHDHRDGNWDIYAQPIGVVSGVHDTPRVPAIALAPNYPNPFTGNTTLSLTLPAESGVNIDVFDVAGRRVRHEDFGKMNAGWSALSFDGRDDQAHALPSGVYFYRLRARSEAVTRKMVIQR